MFAMLLAVTLAEATNPDTPMRRSSFYNTHRLKPGETHTEVTPMSDWRDAPNLYWQTMRVKFDLQAGKYKPLAMTAQVDESTTCKVCAAFSYTDDPDDAEWRETSCIDGVANNAGYSPWGNKNNNDEDYIELEASRWWNLIAIQTFCGDAMWVNQINVETTTGCWTCDDWDWKHDGPWNDADGSWQADQYDGKKITGEWEFGRDNTDGWCLSTDTDDWDSWGSSEGDDSIPQHVSEATCTEVLLLKRDLEGAHAGTSGNIRHGSLSTEIYDGSLLNPDPAACVGYCKSHRRRASIRRLQG